MTGLSISLFDPNALFYATMIIVITYVALFIPGLMVAGAKPEGVARAISCYLWKTFGLLIMSMSIVQLMVAVINNQVPSFPLLSGLILLLVTGMGIMVHVSSVVAKVDPASSVVARLVFSHTIEIVGGLIAVVSAMSLMLSFLLTQRVDGWELPSVMILLGVTMMLSASLHISGKNRGSTKAVRKRK